MILGIGSDMVEVGRVAMLYASAGARFPEKILSGTELKVMPSKRGANFTHWLARRFAGKEAIAKALGTGIGRDVFFQDISVLSDERGRPHVSLSGRAAKRLKLITPKGKKAYVHISLSDEDDYALAFAVIECH